MDEKNVFELLALFCFSMIVIGVAGYFVYLSWFNNQRFRQLIRRKTSNNRLIKDSLLEHWMLSSRTYIWYARLLSLIGLLIVLVFFSVIIFEIVDMLSS